MLSAADRRDRHELADTNAEGAVLLFLKVYFVLPFPVGAQISSRWLCTILDCVGLDLKYKGGSIRGAATRAVIDPVVPIDVVLDKGRWASKQVFDRLYGRAKASKRWRREWAQLC